MLGLIRICAGVIALYTALVYSYDLQELFGVNAWQTLQFRLNVVRNMPFVMPPLQADVVQPKKPETEKEKVYAAKYKEKWRTTNNPPPPYPKTEKEAKDYDTFHEEWRIDPRYTNLPLPKTEEEAAYVRAYMKKWGALPPPPYPSSHDEEVEIDNYLQEWGYDPRILTARGTPISSIWFHVTDPTWMVVVHVAIIIITFLFTIGFCTRLTSVLAWAGSLSYIHRASATLFGADTMMNILLIYLMIGPSGAALSVDRLLARWWAKARPRVLGRWRAFWDGLLGRQRPAEEIIAPGQPPSAAPVPSVSANVALRLLQVHVCIIYLAAGLSKLHGESWWTGTAVWGTLANYEFAPMQYGWYNWALRALAKHQLLLQTFLTFGTYFTLVFEVGYAFLIWRPGTRWVILSMAIILHGVIGVFMGLKTFALVMVVMNMAFLTPAEARWLLRPFYALLGRKPRTPAEAPAAPPERQPAAALASAGGGALASTHVRRKR
jgi:hypothetical protein